MPTLFNIWHGVCIYLTFIEGPAESVKKRFQPPRNTPDNVPSPACASQEGAPSQLTPSPTITSQAFSSPFSKFSFTSQQSPVFGTPASQVSPFVSEELDLDEGLPRIIVSASCLRWGHSECLALLDREPKCSSQIESWIFAAERMLGVLQRDAAFFKRLQRNLICSLWYHVSLQVQMNSLQSFPTTNYLVRTGSHFWLSSTWISFEEYVQLIRWNTLSLQKDQISLLRGLLYLGIWMSVCWLEKLWCLGF